SFREFDVPHEQLRNLNEVILLGMGTSLHAAMIGEYLLEDWVGLPARAVDASEFRYRRPTFADNALGVVITQSGETADTLVGLERRQELVEAMRALPDHVKGILARDKEILGLANKYSKYRNFMYAGRGIGYPVALEGALKLKEISYIHAEGTSGGELKHGPIALLDDQFPVVAICTASATKDKMVSNVHEIVARNAPVLALVTKGDRSLDDVATDIFEMPAVEETVSAI